MKPIFYIATLSWLLTSCMSSNNVTSHNLLQKRKYNKGWHWNLNVLKHNKSHAERTFAHSESELPPPEMSQTFEKNTRAVEITESSILETQSLCEKMEGFEGSEVTLEQSSLRKTTSKTSSMRSSQAEMHRQFRPSARRGGGGNFLPTLFLVFGLIILVSILIILFASLDIPVILVLCSLGLFVFATGIILYTTLFEPLTDAFTGVGTRYQNIATIVGLSCMLLGIILFALLFLK